ncbi:MAG: Mur ligase family protein [Miltoncostaeaceae bacterium]
MSPVPRVPGGPAIAVARAVGGLSRRLGRGGGTSLPGMVLLRMRPGVVGELGARLGGGTAVVSATNGKTTTTRLIAACLREAGRDIVSNPSGANLLTGVATALMDARVRRDDSRAGLFEVDEAALTRVAAELRPGVVLLMNLFRDQLDRYGELETIAARWGAMVAGLPAGARVIANADDPAVAELVHGRPGEVAERGARHGGGTA